VDQSSSALSTGSVCAVEGTYGASCTNPAGSGGDYAANTPWTILSAGASLQAGHEPALLAVTVNNAACILAITDVIVNATSCTDATWADYVDYQPAAAYTLTTSYAASALSFDVAGDGNAHTKFYANFKASSLSFASSFTLAMLFSSNVNQVFANLDSSGFATQVAMSIPAGGVSASSSHYAAVFSLGQPSLGQMTAASSHYGVELGLIPSVGR
jgi:hypothetical protein